MDFSLRYHYSTSISSTIDQGMYYRTDILPWLTGNFGLRFSEEAWALYSFDYKAEISANYLGFAKTTVRLAHSNYFVSQTGLTSIFALETLHADPFDFFGVFGSFGLYQRFTSLSGAPIFPSFNTDGLVDGDFLIQLGFRISPSHTTSITMQIANFEDIDVYNLNNPFGQVSVAYQGPRGDWTASVFGRYRILLGFGQLDEFMVGVGFSILLNKPADLEVDLNKF